MPGPTDSLARFEPPAPGAWTLDTAHFPQPATRFVVELFGEPSRRGFAAATARYGLLMDYIEWAFVNGWAYLCPRPVQSRAAGMTKANWEALVASRAGLRERLNESAMVFEDKRWREDVERWDRETKPRMIAAHRALQAEDPSALGKPELLLHLDRCRRNLRTAIYEHHRLGVGPVIPAGDFLIQAREWTGLSVGDLVQLVVVAGPRGAAAGAELAELARALRVDSTTASILSSAGAPDAVLAQLAVSPGEAGRAASAYLELVSYWSTGGFDIAEPYLLELPHLLLAAVRAAMEGADPDAGAGLLDAARAAVPRASRDAFDELLGEARATHRLRDERALYCDGWAYGLTRRAVLAAGGLLAGAGAIAEPAYLLEADYEEMRSLIEGGLAPSSEELAARARGRARALASEVPVTLGDEPGAPIPLEWLAPGPARTERAFRTYLGAMSGEVADAGAGVIAGVPASPGTYQGRARLVRGPADLGRIERGDILVTGAAAPSFNVVLPLLGAIVTDRGGLLSHAAIVAREFGIPAVVGTGDATTRIPDGSLVRVDGGTGQAEVQHR